jgi:hypothetical protein
MMVECGDADAMISGTCKKLSGYDPSCPSNDSTGRRSKKNCRMYLMLTKKGPYFLLIQRSTLIHFPELADITIMVAGK